MLISVHNIYVYIHFFLGISYHIFLSIFCISLLGIYGYIITFQIYAFHLSSIIFIPFVNRNHLRWQKTQLDAQRQSVGVHNTHQPGACFQRSTLAVDVVRKKRNQPLGFTWDLWKISIFYDLIEIYCVPKFWIWHDLTWFHQHVRFTVIQTTILPSKMRFQLLVPLFLQQWVEVGVALRDMVPSILIEPGVH